MKKVLIIVITAFISLMGFQPQTGKAASKEIYYSAAGSSKNSPGIYKSKPNGKSKIILKEKMYKKSPTEKKLIKLNDVNYFYVNGPLATKSDLKNPYSVNTQPITDVQASGKDLYFTKFQFGTEYGGGMCGGGGADILGLYKRNSKGKLTKVVTDKISSDVTDSFVISGSSLYYAKVTNEVFGNFTIIKSSLDGKKKRVLYKGVEDFWITGKTVYFIKNSKLYTMGLTGKGVKKVSTVKQNLIGMNGCSEGNYHVSKNGIVIDTDGNSFYDFATKKVVKLPENIGYPGDVDLKKKRIISVTFNYETESATIRLYNFKGKKVKTLKKNFDHWYLNLIEVDAKKGYLLYTEGAQLKQRNF
jgi:hypothetical protein